MASRRDFKRQTLRLSPNHTRIFDFDGGSVEISRAGDGSTWAHITVLTADRTADEDERGRVVATRIDRTRASGRADIGQIDEPETLEHVAVRIATGKQAE